MSTTPAQIVVSTEVSGMVSSMFDDSFLGELPENFDSIDPVEFAHALLLEKKSRGWSSKINLGLSASEQLVIDFLNKLEKAKSALSDEQWSALKNTFTVSLDISVWGSSSWEPRVLYNGGVLIRNHHRVVGFTESLAGSLPVELPKLHADLDHLQQYAVLENEDDDFGFFLLHRHSDTQIAWTKVLPTQFSSVGQTLIFIPKSYVEFAKKDKQLKGSIFANKMLLSACENSRTGHCVLRTFADKIFVYSTYRASDELDSICEEYAYYIESTPDHEDASTVQIYADYSKQLQAIADTITDRDTLDQVLPSLSEMMQEILKQKVLKEYAGKKHAQMQGQSPIFATSMDYPPSYYQEKPSFWEQYAKSRNSAQAVGYVMSFDYQHVNALHNFVPQTHAFIEKFIAAAAIPAEHVRIYLPLNEDTSFANTQEDADYFIAGTDALNARLEQISKNVEASFKQMYENWESMSKSERKAEEADFFLGSCEFRLAFLIPDAAPDLPKIHKKALQLSKKFKTNLTLGFPQYGISHGYSGGELDTGNLELFIPNIYS